MTETRKTLWSHTEGERPHVVRVYERTAGGLLHARVWDKTARHGQGDWRRVALNHRDKKRAKRQAIEFAAKLQKGDAVAEARVTLAQVFSLYVQHKTPDKSSAEQKADVARVEMWTRVLGAKMDPHNLTSQQWREFIRARTSGAIDARGNAVAEDKRKPLRARAPEADCLWLKWVFNWAHSWKLPSGRYLMNANPIRGRGKDEGFDVPKEKNVRRPRYTAAEVKALRVAADSHTMQYRTPKEGTERGFKRVSARSYMPELIALAEGTARRIGAIVSLRYSDLSLTKTADDPYGAIQWPGDTDKEGREWTSALTPRVRQAIDRILKERPGIGTGYLFPAPGNPSQHVAEDLVTRWLKEVEDAAKVEHVEGRAWHGFRRKWASERKHMPDVDVMAAGGWKSPVALKASYQHSDRASARAVVLYEAPEAQDDAAASL